MRKIWFYRQGEKQFGPFEADELKRLARSGTLQPSNLVSRDGFQTWAVASRVKGLFDAVAPASSTPPVSQVGSGERRERDGRRGESEKHFTHALPSSRTVLIAGVITGGFVACLFGVGLLTLVTNWRASTSPVEVFEKLARQSSEKDALYASSFWLDQDGETFGLLPLTDWHWDVRKGESLRSPYIGSLDFSTIHRQVRERCVIEADVLVELTYRWSVTSGHGTWIDEEAVITEQNWRVVEHDDAGAARKVVDELNRQPPLIRRTRDWNAVTGNLRVMQQGFATENLSGITSAQAGRLGRHGFADLSGLKTIRPGEVRAIVEGAEETARVRKGYKHGDLLLNGLEEVPDEVAKELARYSGFIQLNGVLRLSPAAAKFLANQALPSQGKPLFGARNASGLSLGRLDTLSLQVAGILAEYKGGWLNLRLESITPAVAGALSKYGGNLKLDGITGLSPEAAAALAQFEGTKLEFSNLHDPEGEAVALLRANRRIELPSEYSR